MPGTEARQTLPDDSWLIQKHRETVQDFCDVASPEKEYIKEWDTFIQRKRIVSEAFIGRAVEEFVMEKVDWLLGSASRTLQFGKHLTVLAARGVEEDTVKLVQTKLREARIQRLSVTQASAAQAPAAPPKRNANGCAVCGKVARGPTLLTCANKVSMLIHVPGALKVGLVLISTPRTPAPSHFTTAAAYVTRHACQWITRIGNATIVQVEVAEFSNWEGSIICSGDRSKANSPLKVLRERQAVDECLALVAYYFSMVKRYHHLFIHSQALGYALGSHEAPVLVSGILTRSLFQKLAFPCGGLRCIPKSMYCWSC